MKHALSRKLTLLAALPLALSMAACQLAVDSEAGVPHAPASRQGFTRPELERLKNLQCYSEDLTVTLDLRNEDLSREPRFPSAPADLLFKDPDLNGRFGKVYLGYPETSYFYRKDSTAQPGRDEAGYELHVTYRRSGSTYDFEITMLSPDSIWAESKVTLAMGSETKSMQGSLRCTAY